MNSSPLTRRDLIKTLAAAGTISAMPSLARAASGDRQAAVVDYLETLAKSDGGYGWGDQEISHLTPTFHVIGAYRTLKRTPPRKDALSEFVRTHHPREIKKLEQERRI